MRGDVKAIRIGCGAGYSGDRIDAAVGVATKGWSNTSFSNVLRSARYGALAENKARSGCHLRAVFDVDIIKAPVGRQVQLSMLPDDRDALLAEIRSHADVELVMRDGDSSDVQPLASIPGRAVGTLILWNKLFTPTLERKLVNTAVPPYHRIDESALPVLEFSDCILTEWHGSPALTQGRIYGQFNGKATAFEKWFESTVRYIRRCWQKNPVPELKGYVGPAASKWFDAGGLLLPMFVPPVTADWLRVINRQHIKV